MLEIEYGPPATHGVKDLQYLNGDGDADFVSSGIRRFAKPIGLIGAATWIYATLADSPGLKRQALAVSLSSLALDLFTRNS